MELLDWKIKSLGERSRKSIKKLKRKEGKLCPKVQKAIDEAVADVEGDVTVLPVVIIITKRPKVPWPWDQVWR